MSIRLGYISVFFLLKIFLEHAIDMKNESFIYFTITYEINNFDDNFLNIDFRKKRILFNETTLRTLPFIKVSLKSNGLSILEKIHENK